VPTRRATDVVIIQFLEESILSRFGVPRKIITDNEAAFRSKKMVNFCNKYHIRLGHSTAYYPQGNGLAESSNKSLMRIVKKLLQENKKAWHSKLTHALWADQISMKKSIGTSPFQLVYGVDAIFPNSLSLPVRRLLQEEEAEIDPAQRRTFQLVELQQQREQVFGRAQLFQEKVKGIFDRKTKPEDFQVGDMVLKWDAVREDKGKHGKFDHLWKGPYKVAAFAGNNDYMLEEAEDGCVLGTPVNGRLLKHYFV